MAYVTDELVRRGHRGFQVVKSRLDRRIAQEERGGRVAGS
jgi:hypothetical protein